MGARRERVRRGRRRPRHRRQLPALTATPRPSTVTERDVRRFAADAALILAGGRAILLQVADPVVGVGVARHSDFVRRPQQRLVHTLMYVYAVVLGSPSDARTAAEFVHRAHAPVAGADDPERQLWVAATLYDSAIRMHEALHGPMRPELAAALLRAYAPLGTALHLAPGAWPTTLERFEAYWSTALTRLRVTDDARGIVRDLMHPRFAPWWIRAAMPLVRVVTIGLIPPVLRAQFGVAWGGREQHRFDRTIACVRRIVRTVPGPLRRLPARLLLMALRRSTAVHTRS